MTKRIAVALALLLSACVTDDGGNDADLPDAAEMVDADLPECLEVCGDVGYHCDGPDTTECSCDVVSAVIGCDGTRQ